MTESVGPRIPLPWSRSCFVCGQDNPQGLQARSYVVGETIELPFVTRPEHVGWNDVLHGGIIGTVLDEVMTWAAILGATQPCFAADFQVRLSRPLPPGVSCVATARLAGRRRRIFDTEARLLDESGLLYARATGRYLPLPSDQKRSLRQDFVTSPDCLDVERYFTR